VDTVEGVEANTLSLAAMNGVWMLTRFWQNICGLLAWFWLVTGGQPISDR
jgi:hypothetical protein